MAFIHTHADRRLFLRQSASMAALGVSPFAMNLALMGGALAQTVPDGEYRALVCLYLGGGNDNANTVVPTSSTEHADYAAARGPLTLSTQALAPTSLNPQAYSGPPLALHPALVKLRERFNSGQVAMVANVGMLSRPTTQADWNKGSPKVEVPIQLFSHSDQSREWQVGSANKHLPTGWLGRAADSLVALNQSDVSMCVSLAGNNMIQVGRNVTQYQLTVRGPVAINGLDNTYGFNSPVRRQLLTDANRVNLMERELTRIARRAIQSETVVRGAIAPTATLADFPGGSLGAQLRMVTRMIAARNALGHKRQIFYVSLGGFDFHADLLTNQATKLAEVDAALNQFQTEIDLMGLGNQVTTFTMSEFGRALQANASGSDHGWGSHHFVMGGAVRGQKVYGQWPTVKLKGPEDAGNGRLIPTTPVEAYAATLATWLGVKADALGTVLPHLNNFGTKNLGFLNA